MNLLEKIKLRHRALKYKNRDDKGGISYINNSVKKGDTIFDIGAHKAGYLYFMEQNVGKDGKIYAFEPQSLLYAYLVKIKDIMHWGNITIEKIAMSDNEGSVTLFIPSNKTGQSTSPSATILENNTLTQIRQTILYNIKDKLAQDITTHYPQYDTETTNLLTITNDILHKHKLQILHKIIRELFTYFPIL